VLPSDVRQALGLRSVRTIDFVLADGTVIQRGLAHCFFTYQDVLAPSPVVLGEANDVALLGAVTLESMGLVLNPLERTLKPARMSLAALT
jgi:predicted aspartyl protease